MYTIELTAWERIQLDIALPRNATWTEFEQLLKIADALALSDDEEKAIDYQVQTARTVQGQEFDAMTWDNAKVASLAPVHVKLESADFDKLKKSAEARTNWPRDRRSVALKAKFESAVED